MLKKETKYSYKDVTIVPATISNITSRSECIPTDVFGYYPLITAPMTSVVDDKTVDNFENNRIYSIMPRSLPIIYRMDYGRKTKRWIAVSLSEFENIFIEQKINEENFGMKILIDIANGHMRKLFDLVRETKRRYGSKNIQIMIGNIANPQTYLNVIDCGADACRCAIGVGSGCLTSSNCGTGFPIASLIDEINTIRQNYAEDNNVSIESLPKIVADGGIRNYSDAIKALALGADYVMIGSVFASLLGSAGEITNAGYHSNTKLNADKIKYVGSGNFVKVLEDEEVKVYPMKVFYGMASKEGQKDLGNKELKTAEGLLKKIPMISDIKSWIENFDSYLRSAMSYTDAKNLKDFQRNTLLTVVSSETVRSINQ